MWTLRIVHFDINTLQENNFSDTFTCQARQECSLCPEVRRYTRPTLAICREIVSSISSLLVGEGCHVRRPSGHQSLVDSRTALRRLAYPALTVLKATRGKEACPSRSCVSSSTKEGALRISLLVGAATSGQLSVEGSPVASTKAAFCMTGRPIDVNFLRQSDLIP